jgi:hypothetical protein
VGAAVAFVVTGLVGFLPLFGPPGYENALAAGLILPSAAAISTAVGVARGQTSSPLASVGRGAGAGLGYAAIAVLTSLLHALRVGICELWGALVFFLLTAGIGAVLGGVWGAAVGEVVRAAAVRRIRLWAVLLALAGPVSGVVVSLYRFVTSPMIFAFDPFVGYFSGSLYDTVIDPGTALLTYRLGSAATLAAAALGASVLLRTDDARAGVVLDLRTAATRVRAGLAFAFLAASVGVYLAGTRLGHYSTTASIEHALGAEKHGERCDVVYPSTTRELDAALLVKDCDEELAAVEKSLGAKGPPRIRAFFFRDDAEKGRLMGAAHVFIAKPWRKEVYLQAVAYPHPVLGHELAHVVAGSFGQGPFRIAGSLGGWLPNPGLIEGVAVAASPEDDDLTGSEWARAMMDIGILPPISRVFSFGFFGDSSAKSYTLAGAFVTWVGETWGMDAVRRWYGGADVEAITGKRWPELDAAFRASLERVSFPPEAASFAKAKFSRPGLFGRRCPHVVDALRHEADVCRDSQRFAEAIRDYDRVLAKDPTDFASRYGRAVTERRVGRLHGAVTVAALEALAGDAGAPRTWRDRAQEAIADAEYVDALEAAPAEKDALLAAARARYEELARHSLDEDAARTLEVKALATTDPPTTVAVGALLLGDATHPPDIFLAGVALGALRSAEGGRHPEGATNENSPLASYLVGRNLIQRAFYERGRAAIEADFAGMPTPRIAREALRQEAIAACALGDSAAIAALRLRLDEPGTPFGGASGGRRAATRRLLERCRAR